MLARYCFETFIVFRKLNYKFLKKDLSVEGEPQAPVTMKCDQGAEELNTMSTGEDEPSASLNGRLRPRKSTSTSTPSPQNKTIRKTEGKLAQDRPKRTSVSSKASPVKQDDLVTKSYAAPAPFFLCPYCDKTFNARQTASKHARRIHLSTSKQDNFIKCLYCNNSDADSNSIIKHMVDSHPNQYFACLDCHTRFSSTTDLAEHKHNVCEKQKTPYRSKLRQKTSPEDKKNPKNLIKKSGKASNSTDSTHLTDDLSFNGIVISCELKPSDSHDAVDIEDKITTNLILPSSKTLANTPVEKNAVIVLDDLQWNKRIPPNFSFHNSDADQILSRLGVVHRSPRVGESREDLIRMMDEPNEKFEKCFDTSFYSKVAKNVQENLAKYLDGTFNFNPNKEGTLKTRKSKASVTINTAEGFPILLAHEQFSRSLFDGFITRGVAPKHKWKWDTAENDKNLVMLLDQTKNDSHVNNCIITLISSLDIWTQLRMKSKFEEIFKTMPTAKKTEKQNIISMELKEILESRDIPSTSSQVVQYKMNPVEGGMGSELPAYLGLSTRSGECELKPAVLSGEWVRPRCYVCCACGDQTHDARTLSAHLAAQHPNAQVQHYEIVGETLLRADILKHLYVPPSQMSNRTRPPRGIRDCTKCKKSVTLEDLHQHMLDCAGDTPTVRRKCRYRPFGVRRRRPRLPDNTIRKKMRKDIRSRHRQKSHMRPRPRTRTEVGDAETIRKMIADLPAKRNRITSPNVIRPRRTVLKTKKQVKLRSMEDKKSKRRPVKSSNKPNKTELVKKQNETDYSSTVDEDDQPLKLSATRVLTRTAVSKASLRNKATIKKNNKNKQSHNQDTVMERYPESYRNSNMSLELYNYPFLVNYGHYGHIPISQIPVPCPTTMHYTTPVDEGAQRLAIHETSLPMPYVEHGMWHTPVVPESSIPTQQESSYEMPQESSHQWVDVKNAGPSNIRQHSSRDDNKMHSSTDRSVGGGDGSNQNNNIAQKSNVPLKHSVTNLTSDTDSCDSSMPYQPINDTHGLRLEKNINIDHEAESRKAFENEATADKVDKPPLTNNPAKSENTNTEWTLPNNPTEDCALRTYATPPPCDLSLSRNPIAPLHEPVKFQVAGDQMILQKDSIELHDCVPHLPVKGNLEPQKLAGQSPVLKDSKELAGLHKNNKIAHWNAITKNEVEKSKFNKIRKGLNDCIAMLRTKKGLRLDKATCKQSVVDTESDIVETVHSDKPTTVVPKVSPTVVPELSTNVVSEVPKILVSEVFTSAISKVPTTVVSDPSLSTNNATEEKANNNIDAAPTHSPLPAQSDNTSLQQTKTPMDSEHASLNSIKQQDETNLTTSFSHKESNIMSKLNSAEGTQTEPSRDESVRSKHFNDDDSELTTSHNIRRDSHDDIPISEELKPFYDNRVSQTVKTLNDFNMPNLTQDMIKAHTNAMKDAADKEMQLLNKHNHRKIEQMPKRESAPEPALLEDKSVQTATTLQGPISSQAVPHINFDTEDDVMSDERISSRQSNVSPTARRTRRKPIKNKANFEKQPEVNSEHSIPHKNIVVPPVLHDSQRIGMNSIDLNMRHYNPSYLPPLAPLHETPPLKTPPPPPPPNSIYVQRRPYKRVSDSPGTSATVVENKDNVAMTKMDTLSNMPAEIIMRLQDLQRQQQQQQAMDFANAQARFHNYNNFMAQSYNQKKSDKSNKNKFLANREKSHSRKKSSPNDSINDNTRYDKSTETHSRYTANSTYVSMTHDTHGVMHVNPKILRSNISKSNTHEQQDNHKTTPENEQYMSVHKQRSDYLEAKGEHSKSSKHGEKHFSRESKVDIQKSGALDTNSHLVTTRRTPEPYYNRTSPYQCNIPNKSARDHFLEMGFDKNKETHDNTSRTYHEPVGSFAVPTGTYSKSVPHLKHDVTSLVPSLSCEPNGEEMTPLDLSCDAKIRKAETLNLDKKQSVSKSTCNISISNEHSDEISMNPSFRRNCTGQLHNLSQHSLSSESNPTEASNVPMQNTGQKNLEMSSQECTHPPALLPSTELTQSTNCANLELSQTPFNNLNKKIDYEDETTNKIENTGNANNHSTDEVQSLPPECNYAIPHDSQLINSKMVHHKESKQEKALVEIKKKTQSTAQVSPEAKFEEKTSKNMDLPCGTTNTVNHNVENINPHGSYAHIGHRMATPSVLSTNDLNNKKYSILDNKPMERNAQISIHEVFQENDNTQIEQDAETARKIAMLPEELVKILGTIPKDHRNQLLNVLPQYVSTPVSNLENDKNNTLPSSDAQKNNESRKDIKQISSACSDSNRLSVNTAISPSSVIPKKRHSPLHSSGRLNSNDLQSTGPILSPSFAPPLSQRSPTGHNESMNNSNEIPALVGTSFYPTTSTQDLSLKLLTKQKPPNEQTASLRAVRIKTTSTKKSFPDDKKLLTNSSYTTNVDEKCSNTGPAMSQISQTCNRIPTDVKYDNAKSINQPLENSYGTEVILQDATKQNTDYFQDSNKTLETITVSDKKEELNDNFTLHVPHHTKIPQNESKHSFDTPKDSTQVKTTITLEPLLSLESTNMSGENFLEQINLSTSSIVGIHQDEVLALKPKNISFNNVLKNELQISTSIHYNEDNQNDLTPLVKTPNEIITITENKTEKSYDINKQVQPLLSTSTNNQDEALNDEISDESLVSSLLLVKNVHDGSTKHEKSNEDESDDDMTLAIIKQKHCKVDSKVKKNTTKQSKKSPKKKKKNYLSKLVSKRKKKKLLKSSDIIQNSTPSDDIAHDCEFIQPFVHTEVGLNEVNDDNCKSVANMLPITTAIGKAINEIKENDDSLIPGSSKSIISALDNFINKNEHKKSSNEIIDVHDDLLPEKTMKAASDEIQNLPNLNITQGIEIDKTYVSVEEYLSKFESTNNVKSDNSSVSDLDREKQIDLNSSMLNNMKPDKIDYNAFTEVSRTDSSKIPSFATPIDSVTGDLQLSSEISEVNTLPLRRSRRGKSMYVDGSYTEDYEQIEDRTKNTPLTMKRLILSRVEKEKKRVSESNLLGKRCDATDDNLLISTLEPELSSAKKAKLIKRKKSPNSKRMSKKIKELSVNEQETELSDPNSLYSTSENKICVLQELSNAENTITEKDSCDDDFKCAISDNTTSSEVITTIGKDTESNEAGDDIIEIQETTVSVKRKITAPSTDLVSSKSKKTKYHKKKPLSDFDSDDDKVLLETKQKIATEKHFNEEHDSSNISKEEEDNNGKSPKSLNKASCEILKQIANDSVPVETRVTCYSRSISNRRPRSSSNSPANYDPYDIDFIDMLETTGPIIKKKGKTAGRQSKLHHGQKLNIPREGIDNSSLKKSKQSVTKTQTNTINESDSDSSKSDVPLQKYVDIKTSKMDSKNKNNKNSNESTDETATALASNQKCLDIKQSHDSEKNDNNDEKTHNNSSNAEVSTPCKSKKSTKRVTTDDNLSESGTPIKDDDPNTNNNILVDQTTQKHSNKQKKTRRAPAVHNVDSTIVSNEDNQQQRSDNFMEKFGFYSERIPRKSNLLASKKISETFHLICNETDDFSSSKDKSSKKSTTTENKKKSESGSNIIISQDSRASTSDVQQVEQPTTSTATTTTTIASTSTSTTTAIASTSTSTTTTATTSTATTTTIASTSSFTTTTTSTTSTATTTTASTSIAITTTATFTENLIINSSEPKIDIDPNKPVDVVRVGDSELGSVEAQPVMSSEHVKYLESNLFYNLADGDEAKGARNGCAGYQNTGALEMTAKDDKKDFKEQTQIEDKVVENPESTKKTNRSKQNKQPGVKDKMYPDIEEIDMFEDKFDKIKRKRRSQAVAARQEKQVVAETNTSAKSRKKSDKKKSTKSTKKNYQNTQVPTKGALKGFEGIKISISTQDLNMPINVSPPRQSKKRRKTTTKRRKDTSDSESSLSEFEGKDKLGLERDIYEFKDSEDTELFDLRPSTVMNRFRSMHNNNQLKNKDKDKTKDMEKLRSREKERKAEGKDSTNFEAVKERNRHEKGKKNSFSREERRGIVKERNYSEKNLDKSHNEESYTKLQKGFETASHEDDNFKKADSAKPSTSGLIPDRMQESDYESEMSSPEGDFIFYMSNDTNCICPSDNDSDDSDVERGCGRLNCVNKNRNADKNAAIENIFKNNAVRCEKPEIKVPENPRPNLDQLFDSLLETESKPKKNGAAKDQINDTATKSINLRRNTITSPEAQHNLNESKDVNLTPLLDKDIITIFDDSSNTTNFSQSLPTTGKDTGKQSLSKSAYTSSLCQNDILSDSGSMQIFTVDDKQKESVGYSLMSEESTQVNFMDIIAHASGTNDETNDKTSTNIKATKTGASNQTHYNSEDEFDIDKPEALNRQFMHLILPAEKASTCVQTDSRIENCEVDSVNESAASKYLKGLSPAEAANMEIYTMVSAQSTQTSRSTRHIHSKPSKHYDISKSEDESDMPVVPRNRIRLQKYDINEIAQKTTSTKSIQTEINKDYKPPQYESDSDDDFGTDKCNSDDEKLDQVKSYRASNSVFDEDKEATLPVEVDAFTAPVSRSMADKHSPRKSDEGIGTSYDYSADAFEQSFDNAGVAHQRARRKCTVGKQNVLAEHWSSESEFDGGPARPNSADSVVASAARRKKSRKKEHAGGRKAGRHGARGGRGRARGEEGEASARAPPGPKMRARAAHYWSSEGEEAPGPPPQHGWIVGDSHKKLVTMLAHAKGRKRNHADKYLD